MTAIRNYRKVTIFTILICFSVFPSLAKCGSSFDSLNIPENRLTPVATFSIVAGDPETGELGVAVASRFFGVGTVVPWARAGVGAVATQSYANTSFGWRGLDLLENSLSPDSIVARLLEEDDNPTQRQFGIVSAAGKSATYTGEKCLDWAGGRNGAYYAIQGNILAGEEVVTSMEETFLASKGSLAERLYAALLAGDSKGGDSRGKQSAALLVVKANAGYGGYTDRAIDIRVDDHTSPFKELGRLLKIAQVNYSWNEAWTLFTNKRFKEALPYMENTARLAPENGEVLYDLAVIRLAAGMKEDGFEALKLAIKLNPKLVKAAATDNDIEGLKSVPGFEALIQSGIE